MNDQPITKKIKARLQRYTAMLRDIDNQIERLDRMESTMTSASSSNLSGMPKSPGVKTDRTAILVIHKMELEEKIKRTVKKERAENAAIEAMIEKLEKPDERAVIRLRYFDRAEWDGITSVLFGDREDYIDRLDSYQNRTYKMHGRALLELAAILEAEEVNGTKEQQKE